MFKMSHRGKPLKIQVLENYLAPDDITIEDTEVKKGSWILAVRVLDKLVWEKIKVGELTGFSMAGLATGNKLTKTHVNGGLGFENESSDDLFPSIQLGW